ncbi:MAG: type III secretion system gatekeeper subunit SctW [Kiritimatiellae bacterium]|nr:type III secretion system gatekeeper subunit SctW [Kiritimatiellia bacterium]
MALDAAQILRQTYAAGADAARLAELALPQDDGLDGIQDLGELMGTDVVVEDDPDADLMDSMEELAFQFEEKAVKTLAERRLGPVQGSRASFARALEAWFSLMPDMPGRDRLDRFAQNLRRTGATGTLPSREDILKALGRESTDPSHQFAMLDLLEQMFGEDEKALLDLIRQTRTQLMAEKGADIKAGINLAEEVNARASTPGEMQDLRDLYRSEVVGFTKVQDCFRSLLAQRGPSGLGDAIDFLIAGCGKDLAAQSPSMDKAELGRILTDLQCVQVLQTVMDAFSRLSARMGTQFADPCLLDGQQLTGQVLELTERSFVPPEAIAHLLGECGMRKLLSQMDFTRELTRLFRQLSPRLFAKEGDRQRLVDAAQEHLDGLVAIENEQEAQS